MASQTNADIEFPALQDRLLVIYDGQCGFCNGAVRWFLKRDALDRLRFAPSQSPSVAELLRRHGFDAIAPNTLIVGRNAGKPLEQVLTRTDGVLEMLSSLPKPWPSLAILLKMCPRPVRDLGYRLVAALRYRLAGRYATCPIPSAEDRAKFLGI
jgi:predicted DCC family thiol-disulfide oxidoreductase YuxK